MCTLLTQLFTIYHQAAWYASLAKPDHRHKILILGDSHAEVFLKAKQERWLKQDKLWVVSVGGASAYGIRNRHSQSKALARFRKALWFLRGSQASIVLMLGEVDCGYLLWQRADFYGTEVELQLEKSLQRYEAFVEEVSRRRFNRVVILGVNPPILTRQDDWERIVPNRKNIDVSIEDRILLTRRFNQGLMTMAARTQCQYTDIWDSVFDAGMGRVKVEYLPSQKNDHHLPVTKTWPLWRNKLKGLGVLSNDSTEGVLVLH